MTTGPTGARDTTNIASANTPKTEIMLPAKMTQAHSLRAAAYWRAAGGERAPEDPYRSGAGALYWFRMYWAVL